MKGVLPPPKAAPTGSEAARSRPVISKAKARSHGFCAGNVTTRPVASRCKARFSAPPSSRITGTRPTRPAGRSVERYAPLPAALVFRETRCHVVVPTIQTHLAWAASKFTNANEKYRRRLAFVRCGLEYTQLVVDARTSMQEFETSKGKDSAAQARVLANGDRVAKMNQAFPPFAITWQAVFREPRPEGDAKRGMGRHPNHPLSGRALRERHAAGVECVRASREMRVALRSANGALLSRSERPHAVLTSRPASRFLRPAA